MNALPGLQPVLQEIAERFGDRLGAPRIEQPDEIYFDARMELVSGFRGHVCKVWGARLVSVFAEDARAEAGVYYVYYAYALDAAHGFLILRAPVAAEQPEFVSLTNAVHSVNWQEREIQDLFGLRLIGHPNARRCVLHDNWPDVHPLRKDFDLRAPLPPFQGPQHDFRTVEGEGVFQIPVGPVHAGVIEPGHFRFSVAGEPVLYLQLRLFYTHKGTEKLFENMPVTSGVRLAESISGDSSFAHATAFCHAVERAVRMEVPPRARALRTVGLELERLYNHIADIGLISNDVAFAVPNAHAMRLKEKMLRLNEFLTGNRLLRGMACLGGVQYDWDRARTQAVADMPAELEPAFEDMAGLIENSSSTRDRLEGTGILKPEVARKLGIVGLAGRASGMDGDLRRDFPHAAYDGVKFRVPVYQAGDVQHRMRVRIEEVRESLGIIRQVMAGLPGEIAARPCPPGPRTKSRWDGSKDGAGGFSIGFAPRPAGRLARCKIKDPSLQNWPALSEAIMGNIVPDFPVINKSFNLSYSGTDR